MLFSFQDYFYFNPSLVTVSIRVKYRQPLLINCCTDWRHSHNQHHHHPFVIIFSNALNFIIIIVGLSAAEWAVDTPQSMQRKVIKTVAACWWRRRRRWALRALGRGSLHYATVFSFISSTASATATAPVAVIVVIVVILDYISCDVVAERAGVASNLLFLLILCNKILELYKLTRTSTHTYPL